MQINPNAEVECCDIFVNPVNISQIIDGSEDYIIDAVDNITAKLAITERAKKMNIAIISSMGTGNKLNPFMYRIDDIYKTSVCPLARVMRRELKARNLDSLTVLYSTETPKIKTSPPSSISYMPPIAGLMIGGMVIQDLTGGKAREFI
jgi:tRNA A37 threonylcarbamoyladenosine dehydratase